MTGLPAGLEQAFPLAAGELGMCSAAWLFARELAAVGGDPLVAALRDALGRAFPVIDSVASAWLGGEHVPVIDPAPVLEACAGATDVVVVGLETLWLDALVPLLDAPIRLLAEGPFAADWDRVLSNYAGRAERTELSNFQQWAGRRSVLLTFVYGSRGGRVHVPPAWARVLGPDVRSQFRSLVGWNVLGAPMDVYPRWLVEVPADDFSRVAG